MSAIGGVRHAADYQIDDLSKEGSAVIGLQMGSNRGASQAGMSAIGGMRHAADYQIEDIAQGVAKMGYPAAPGYGGNQGYGGQGYGQGYGGYGAPNEYDYGYGSYANDGTYGTDW